MSEEENRFSLRKLSVGLASVLIGVSIFGTSQTVKADTVADQNTSAVTSNAQSSDTQENKNAVKSSFSNDNQTDNAKSNLIQTQVEGKKDQKQDSVPKTQEVNDSSNLDAEKSIVRTSSLQEPDNQSNNHAEDNSQTQLNITKNSQQLDQKELATNLTQDNSTQNNDWADPAKQGFHKTTAGWTKLQQGKDYNAVAKKSVLTFYDNGHVISDGQTLHETINKSFENDADISVVIDKDDLKEGNRILIGSTAFLYPDNRRINYESRGGSSYQLADSRTNTTIGNISVSLNSNDPDELDYFLDVKSPDKYVKDLSFTISHASGRGFAKNGADWMNYSRLSGTTTDNPFRTKVLTPQNTTYNIEIEPDSNFNMKYSKIVPTTGSNIVQGVTAGWYSQIIRLHDVNSNYTIAPDDQSDHVFKRVFQLKNLTNQSLIPSDIVINPYIAPINLNNDLGNTKKTTELSRIKAERKADNLTNTQLLEQTARGHYTWSQQSDGSILICYNLHSNDMTLSTPEIDDRLKNTNWWHIENPTNKQQILNHTEDVYKERGNKLIRFSIHPQITVNNYSNKPYNVLVNNLTPTDANDQPVKLYISNLKYVPVGTTLGLDLEAIRNINVKFVDDDNNQKELYDKPLTQLANGQKIYTGSDLHLIIGKDVPVTDNVILSDLQPDLTKFNYDPTTKTFYYGVVKDTNPDIVIHVKHKLIDVSATDPNAKQNNRYRMIENLPDGTKKTLIDLEIESHRTATKDLATGKTTYSDWISKDAVITNHTNNGNAGDPSFIWKVPLDWFNNCTRTFSIPNGYEKVEQNGRTLYTSPLEKDNNGSYLISFISYPDGGVGLDFEIGFPKDNVTTYKAMPASCDFVINYQHNTQKVTDPSQLQTTGKRTITISMPKGHGAQMTIIQTVGYKRTGSLDLYTGKTTYTDWVFDADTSNVTVNGQVSTQYQAYVLKDGVVNYAPIKLPHINGYKAHLVRNKLNPALFMVSFIAVPSEVTPSKPIEEKPSKPSAPADKPFAELDHKVVDALNSNDSGWTMPNTQPATYTVEVPADNTINLSDLVIAEPIHAQTTTQIRVNKRFKLSKKHSIKHLKHRKKAVKSFKKYRL